MEKRIRMAMILAVILILIIISFITGAAVRNAKIKPEKKDTGYTLSVVTTFAGNDGNSQTYADAVAMWEKETGNMVRDMSSQSDETFKTRVINDFQTGSEPDVLFFFTGADADNFVSAGKVVSLEEIREEYPDFADNIDENKVPTSRVDEKIYAIPVNGYWEALYVNRSVLQDVGIEVPGEDYSWKNFISDCAKIKRAGYTPIAVSIGSIPHYWWEYCIFNHTGVENHMTIPDTTTDEIGRDWVEGIRNIKALYDLGYFPDNTTSATDDDTFMMFMRGEAAFLLDGSWKLGTIVTECQANPNDPGSLDEKKLENFTVTFVPGTEARSATDLIGGTSMGYYITRKAWNDPEAREAAISFVSYMTSDDIIQGFAQYTSDVLKKKHLENMSNYNSLEQDAIIMLRKASSLTPAVQDTFTGECRKSTFDGMSDIVKGRRMVTAAVEEGLKIYREEQK
ncbi:MAG: carbohydrate ABC transporter substrate-binding protein [Lachnospiraceae bacterium]|nr:carbohydrate ABC transporter substrate-binding protein [Lachnospiraceae bacterium]